MKPQLTLKQTKSSVRQYQTELFTLIINHSIFHKPIFQPAQPKPNA